MTYKRKLFSFIIAVAVSPSFATNLNETIDYTLKTNPDVLISIRQRQQSDAIMRQDEAGYLPSIDLSGQDGTDTERNQNTANTFDGTDQFLTLNSSSTTAAITENIFSGFKTYFNVRSDLANIASKRYSVNNTAQNTALAVGEVYLNVLRSQQLVAIAQKNVAANIYTHDIIAKRVTRGLSSESELQQAEGRLALARSDLLQEIKGQQDAQAQFVQVVGVEPKNLLMPAQNRIWQKPSSQKDAVQTAIHNNPSLQASRYDLSSAIETHKSAMSPYYPTVDVVASTTRASNIGGTIGPNDADTVYVQANMNLFRGGADYQRVKQTAYQEQEAFDSIEKTQRQVVSNTALAWNAWQTSISDLAQLKIHKDESAKVAAAFRKQYVVGKRTLVDLLNAENESFRAQSAYVDGKFNILLNQYRLLNSEGLILNYFHADLPLAATKVEDPYISRNTQVVKNNELSVFAHPAIDSHRPTPPSITAAPKLKPNYTVSAVASTKPTSTITAKITKPELEPNYTVVAVPVAKPKTIAAVAKPIATLAPNYTVVTAPVAKPKTIAAVAKPIATLAPNYTVVAVPVAKPKTIAAVAKPIATLAPNYTVVAVPVAKPELPAAAVTVAQIPQPLSTGASLPSPSQTLAAKPEPKIKPNYTVTAVTPPHPHYKTTYVVSKVPKYT